MCRKKVTEEMSFCGIYGDIARILGEECAEKIFENFRGQQITFPMHLYTSNYVAKLALDAKNDFSVKQLAKKYGYSERHLARVIKQLQTEVCDGREEDK